MKELPKGVRIDKGYIQVRIFNHGRMYTKNFGRDCPAARQVAEIHLAEKRKEILMGKAGMSPASVSKLFKDAAALFIKEWSAEKDANGQLKHSEFSIYCTVRRIEASLIPYFGHMAYDTIKPVDILKWREKRLLSVSGTTVNREQNTLSSIFSHISDWMRFEKIKPFKIPAENPCNRAEKAPTVKRDRIPTAYELSKLKNACMEMNDASAWDNIALALKTCLSLNDLQRLQLGDTINLNRSKTGVAVSIPITVLHQPDWKNWRKRWEAVRKKAGIKDLEFRDIRKAGGNLLVGKHDPKLISQYMGHADLKTTETFYTKMQADKMVPLAETLSKIVESL